MTHDDIWFAIEQFAMNNKLSCSGLAKSGGLDPTTFNKSKRWSKAGQPRWPSTQSLARVLAATGSNFTEFVQLLPSEHKD
ncbi:MAG: hypothetical protein FWF34_00595 [Alphaproteobacteria bacterium]|nr:hypothetical protein [Alphaproteobacteria bacterium]MCL2889745.1 hypothetical protein [Alphaproteobacteria bacterium]